MEIISVTAAIAAIIAAIPIIMKWLKPKPYVSLSINDYRLTENESCTLYYIIPRYKNIDIYYLQFPIVLQDSTDDEVKDFFFEINVDVSHDGLKRIRGINGYKLITPDGIEHEMEDDNWLNLIETKPFKITDKHTYGNKYNEVVFPSGRRYELKVRLTSTADKDEAKDAFTVKIMSKSKRLPIKTYKFDVHCLYTEENNKTVIKQTLKKDIATCSTFILDTSYVGTTAVSHSRAEGDNLLTVGWFDTNDITKLFK